MPDPNRRSVLVGLLSSAAVPKAMGASDPVAARVQAIRAEWEAQQRKMVLGFIPDGRFDVMDPVVGQLGALCRGLCSVAVSRDVGAIPTEDQVHPAVQQMIQDLATALGEALIDGRRLVEGFLAGEEEGDLVQLRGALRVLRLSSRDWETSEERKGLLKDAFDLGEPEDMPLLRRTLRKAARRVDKLEALVDRAQLTGHELELLGRADPEQEAAAGRGAEIPMGT